MRSIDENLSIKELIDEILKTSIFRKITERNGEKFAYILAIWSIRYILFVSSIDESLQIDLEDILINVHKEKYKEIIEVTEKVFNSINK